MKPRKWRVTYDVQETTLSYAGPNYHVSREQYVGEIEMIPTVGNVRRYIEEQFPDDSVDETWMTLKEQISDGLEYGMFSVSLKEHPNDNMDTRSVGFLEV
jgi:hypothetical protein